MKPAAVFLRVLILLCLCCNSTRAAAPSLDFLRKFGGNSLDQATAVAVDAQGNTYIIGNTTSLDFPVLNPFQSTLRGFQDVFIAKFDTNGATVFSTYLGGSRDDFGTGIAVDTNGNIYVTGYTFSTTNFPTANPLQTTNRGICDVFVAKLNPAGNALIYSTLMGGRDFDAAGGIAVDADGNAIVTGHTQSTNFPTLNAMQPLFGGIGDAFVLKLNASGALVYSTYLGGSGQENRENSDLGGAVALDSAGNVYVTGWTYSTNFPVLNAFQPTNATFSSGLPDAFVMKFNSAGTILYSTYLGGRYTDKARSIAVDPSGKVYVAGDTSSSDFPTRNALQPLYGGEGSDFTGDGFVAALDATGSNLIYSTYLGGAGDDQANGIAVDAAGNVTVTGFTDSPNFPLKDALQPVGNQGLFKSTNAAVSWNVSNTGLASSSVASIQIDPSNPSILYAVTGDGVFKSIDAGAHWSAMNNGIDIPSLVSSIVIDPSNPTTIYAADYTGIFKTTDGASNWTAASAGFPEGIYPNIQVVTLDPVAPTTLYAGTYSRGVYKSIDGGMNWFAINGGLAVLNVLTLLVDPQNPQTVYVGCDDFSSSSTNLFRSTNGGANWTRMVGGGLRAGDVAALAFSPTNSSTLFAMVNPSFGSALQRSTDGGASWTTLLQSSYLFPAFAVAPSSPSTMYLGTEADLGHGVLKSTDGGTNWDAAGLSADTITALAVNPMNSSNIFAGIDGGRDAFVTVLSSNGALSSSTYFGGDGADEGRGVAIDGFGGTHLIGFTSSSNFPPTSLAFAGPKTRAKLQMTVGQVNNSDAYFTLLAPGTPISADVAVSITVDPPRAGYGDLVVYTIQVTNLGPDDAVDVQVISDFSAVSFGSGLQFDLIYSDLQEGAPGYYTGVIGRISPGERIIAKMVIKNRTVAAPKLHAFALSPTPDSNRQNNIAEIAPMMKSADLSTKLIAKPSSAKPGDLGDFVLEITNNGPDDARNVSASFDLSGSVSNFIAFITDCDGTGGIYNCEVGDIPPGGKIEKTFTVVVLSPDIHCTGSAESFTFDPDPSNNHSSIMTSSLGLSFDYASPFAAAPGTQITIKGSGFDAITDFDFNGTPATFQLVNDFTIQTTVPSGATTGPLQANSTGGMVTSPFNFIVFGAGSQPIIGQLSANSGSPGAYVTITGINLAGATVQINGVNATVDSLRSSDSQVVFQIPTGATTGKITVTTFGGTAMTADNFTVTSCGGLTLVPPTLPHGTVGQGYFTEDPVLILGAGGQGTVSFSVAGRLPKGLNLFHNESAGQLAQIAGTPRESGTFTFIITVTDAAGCSVSRMYSLTVDAGASEQIAVTTSEDYAPGSLQDAIFRANAKPGSTIFFCIPQSDSSYDPNSRTFILKPMQPLPAITAPGTRIEGGLKEPATGNTVDNHPNVIIDGSASAIGNGLEIRADQCVIQDLRFSNWTGHGVNSTESLQCKGMAQFADNGGDGLHCTGSVTTESLICFKNAGWSVFCVGDLRLNGDAGGATGFAVAQFCGKGGFSSSQGAVVGTSVSVIGCGQQAIGPTEGHGIYGKTFINITGCNSSGNSGAGCIATEVTLNGDCEIDKNRGDGVRAITFCQMDDAYIHENGGYGVIVENGNIEINLHGKRNSCRIWLNGAGGICVPKGECNAFNLDCSINGSTGLRCESVELTGCTVDFNQGFGCEMDGGTCELLETECVGNTLGGLFCVSPPMQQNFLAAAKDLPGPNVTNLISKSLIASNGGDGLRYEKARPLRIEQSNISANTGLGVNNVAGQTIISARSNWWGAASGPSGAGPGSGDEVSANVDFASWRSQSVTLVVSLIETSIPLAPGDAHTLLLIARNWAGTNDGVQVSYGDPLDWAGFVGAQFGLSNRFVVLELPISVPTNSLAGVSNIIAITASSISNPLLNDSATVALNVQNAVPPRLAVLPRSPGGDFAMQVTGTPGFSYMIESSDHLVRWISLTRRTASSSGFLFSESINSATPHRFYRARRTP